MSNDEPRWRIRVVFTELCWTVYDSGAILEEDAKVVYQSLVEDYGSLPEYTVYKFQVHRH